MCQVTLNNITGEPPYTIQVCDYFGVNCQTIGYFTGYIPPSLTLTIPSPYDITPMIKIVVYDANGCVSDTTLTMMTPTPTQSITPTITVTPTLTPSIGSPTPTPTNTLTPTPTPLCSNIQTSLVQNSVLTLYNFTYVSGTFGVGDTIVIQIGDYTDPYLLGLPIGTNLSIVHDGTYEALYFQITTSTINSGYVEWSIQVTAEYSFTSFVNGDNYTFCYLVPSMTPTTTPTPTLTPTVSPSSESPTPTPTNTQTPTLTQTVSPSFTPTITVSPSFTPTLSPLPPTKAFLFIEPQTGNTSIGQWMYDNGQTFYGFTNNSAPAPNQSIFNTQLNTYVDFSGWTSGLFPSIINQDVPQTTGGNDSFGNAIVAYNFKTTQVSANTVTSGKAWFTWMIPTGMTNGLYQTKIDYSTSSPSMPPTTVNTEPTIYSYYFTYTGSTIPQTTYRVYTTYPSTFFNLVNTSSIYFKGNTVS